MSDEQKKKEFMARFGSHEHIDRLLKTNYHDVAWDLSSNPLLRSDHIDELLKYGGNHPPLTEHPSLNTEQANRLLDSKEGYMQRRVAKNKNLSPESIRHGFNSPHFEDKELLVSHQNVPEDVLKSAVQDLSPIIQSAAIDHPKASPAVLELAAKTKNTSVRRRAIFHPNVTPDILHTLSNDHNNHIRDAAKSMLARFEK